MSLLISWCYVCGRDAEFDHVPEGSDDEFVCRRCEAAVFAGELAVAASA
ncbi:MAG TPA: hypothetical protein VIP77_01800 [Jiangellaceae bacterium]